MPTDVKISVIICTHDPKRHYLQRVIDALRQQTLDSTEWELLLVDNASATPLSEVWDLTWHPRFRHIREERLGLTPARIRGIREAVGESLVFVDDDNVLSPDFLAIATEVAATKLFLGCWGPGIIRPEYESPLPPEFAPYESWWCVKNIARDSWANFDHEHATPLGAGLCIRREPALKVAAELDADDAALNLDRKGKSLACGGDIYICLKCVEYGWGIGVFKDLHLLHLIPPERTTATYLEGLAEGFGYSGVYMAQIFKRVHVRPSRARRILNAFRHWTAKPLEHNIGRARQRGEQKALRELGR